MRVHFMFIHSMFPRSKKKEEMFLNDHQIFFLYPFSSWKSFKQNWNRLRVRENRAGSWWLCEWGPVLFKQRNSVQYQTLLFYKTSPSLTPSLYWPFVSFSHSIESGSFIFINVRQSICFEPTAQSVREEGGKQRGHIKRMERMRRRTSLSVTVWKSLERNFCPLFPNCCEWKHSPSTLFYLHVILLFSHSWIEWMIFSHELILPIYSFFPLSSSWAVSNSFI